MAGTRAVISFFAGIAELDLVRTTILSGISSFLWYGILVYIGYTVGQNWELIREYMSLYSWIVTGIFALVTIVFVVRYFIKRRSDRGKND
jgi:membrane protein DedA with SNARE-associated domain